MNRHDVAFQEWGAEGRAPEQPEPDAERSVTTTLRMLADIEHASPGTLYVVFERAFYQSTLQQIADGLASMSATHTRMSVNQRCKALAERMPLMAGLMMPGRAPRRIRIHVDQERVEQARRELCS